jgi:hypothetical protein
LVGGRVVFARSFISVLGNLPKQENLVAGNVPSIYRLPMNAIDVHENPEARDRVTIKHPEPAKQVCSRRAKRQFAERAGNSNTPRSLVPAKRAGGAEAKGETHGDQF